MLAAGNKPHFQFRKIYHAVSLSGRTRSADAQLTCEPVSRAAAGNVACSWRTNPLLISFRWGRAARQRAVIVYSSSYKHPCDTCQALLSSRLSSFPEDKNGLEGPFPNANNAVTSRRWLGNANNPIGRYVSQQLHCTGRP